MRIALDCRCVFQGMGGIGRYAWSLLQEYQELDRKNSYLCYFTHLSPPGPLRLPDNFYVRIFEAGMIDERFDQFVLPTLLREDRIDLYHNPTFAVPVVRTQARCIATVHDVVFRRRPDLVEPRLRGYLDAATRRTTRLAAEVLTVSEFSKREISDLYDLDPGRVTVVHNGVEPPSPTRASISGLGLEEGKFLLYVGSIEPKKNIQVLLEAFAMFRHSKRWTGVKLVLAGSKLYPVEEAVRALGLGDAVLLPGYVSQGELEALYSSSLAFVYPSLYEGFGIPPLEAMIRGVPTIVSDSSSLPEVVGDSAIRVDPGDPAALSAAMGELAENRASRSEWGRKGRDRASRFTWRRSALKHLAVYDRVMSA